MTLKMTSQVFSATIIGLNGEPIEVEADISSGLPSFLIVGLPTKAVEESKERVRTALKNSGIIAPSGKIIINLAPADVKKEGPAFDLPIAVALAAAFKQISLSKLDKKVIFAGELSLDGNLRQITGILPISIMAKKKGFKKLFIPYQNAIEASFVRNLEIYPLKSLGELINHLKGEKKIGKFKPVNSLSFTPHPLEYEYDFAYIKGQEQAKRALEIAAAGMHNVLMSGPPGGGKTLLARALPSIMPSLTDEEMLDISKIYSVAGLLSADKPLITERPFRSPHHTSSDIALVGGGQKPRPGEITLSHQGVLFLDEMPEFGRAVLEALRQPLEDRVITVSRAAGTLKLPAHFILVGAMNPCPCGYLNDPFRQCNCTAAQIIRYQKRISGPLMDRIDIHLEVPRIKYEKLTDDKVAEESAKVRERVEQARKRQKRRFGGMKANAEMKLLEIKKYCRIDEKSEQLLKQAVNQLNLSVRAYHKTLKLSRTIADLAGDENITPGGIAEAIAFRPKEILY